MKRYAVYALDAWGNEKDGYEVNDYYQQAIYIEADDLPSFEDCVKILKKADFLKKRLKYRNQYPYEEEVIIEYAKTGLPLFSIRKTEDEADTRFIGTYSRWYVPASIYRIHPTRTVKIQ